MIGDIYQFIVYQPLLNTLVFLYEYLPGKDFGIAIIALTIFVRILLYPLSAKAFKAQLAMAELQPKLKELQSQLKNNKDELNRRTLALFREKRVNPLSMLFPLLVQLPILLALFQLFRSPPESISPMFFGILDLSARSIPIAVLSAVSQLAQGKFAAPSSQATGGKNVFATKTATHLFSLFTGFIMLTLPSAVGLYWISTNLFSVWQQWHLSRKLKAQSSNVKTA
ncbi:MAG: membrane protein insertase YidC [Candidatus Wildermuthbacteria bacterium]|nr:membrane protein insertase YidC [Candidatus Wildermuthbacteria bacterium]